MLDYATGLATPVTLSVSGGDFLGAIHAAHGAEPASGTDAYSLFNGIVSGQGALSYVNAAGNALVLTLTGLDPGKTYDLTYAAHRNSYAWDRASLVTLSGHVAFTNTSSTATDNPNESGGVLFTGPTDPSTRLPADNDNGYVARFGNIDPGSDGVVLLTISFDGATGSAYKGKYGSAVRLEENSSTPPPPPSGFTAYNDLAWETGQLTTNITTITSPDGGSGQPSSGTLLDYATGLATPVTLTVSGGDFLGAIHAAHGADPASGTDAHSLFNGIISGQGAVSYVNAAGNALVLTFTGLNPSKTYDLTYFAHRDQYAWDRASLVTLSGHAAFTNTSSVATDNANEAGGVLFTGPTDVSTRLPADNDNGYVARFSMIDPGSDGVVLLTISFDGATGSAYKGKYGSAVRLQENSGSASLVADTPTIHLAALRHSASTGPSMVHRLDWVPPDSPSTIRVGGGALGLRFGLPQLSAAPADPLVHLVSHGSASSTTISPVGGSVLAGSTVTFSWNYIGGGSNGTDVAYKYTGKELDSSTGLYFYEARYYDASLGRFISADTIVPNPTNPQTFNRYSYVINNPLRYTDPSGNVPFPIVNFDIFIGVDTVITLEPIIVTADPFVDPILPPINPTDIFPGTIPGSIPPTTGPSASPQPSSTPFVVFTSNGSIIGQTQAMRYQEATAAQSTIQRLRKDQAEGLDEPFLGPDLLLGIVSVFKKGLVFLGIKLTDNVAIDIGKKGPDLDSFLENAKIHLGDNFH